MEPLWTLIIGLLLNAHVVRAADASDQADLVAGTNDECAKFCSKVFSTQDASRASCQQGCGLYVIIEFVDKGSTMDSSLGQTNFTALLASCQNGCNEVFSDAALKAACGDGCQHQSPFTTGRVAVVMDSNSQMFPFAKRLLDGVFGKFDDMQQYTADRIEQLKTLLGTNPALSSPILKLENGERVDNGNFFDRVYSKIRSMILNGRDSSDADYSHGKENTNKDQKDAAPETVNPLYAYAKSLSRNPEKESTVKLIPIQSPVEGYRRLGALDELRFSVDKKGEPIMIIKTLSEEGVNDELARNTGADAVFFTQGIFNHNPYESLSSGFNKGVIFGNSRETWWACVARRTHNLSVMARWLLCTAMMISSMCMLYLCLSVMRTAKQRRRGQGLQCETGKGDAIYLIPPPAYDEFQALPVDKQSQTPPPCYDTTVMKLHESSVKEL